MYQDDHNFNFYNSQNQNYQGGFGDYADGQNSGQSAPVPPAGGGFGKKGLALLLACVVAGGAAGAGGAALYHNFSGNGTTVIYESQRPAEVVTSPISGETMKIMTAEQLYAANLASCVGITVSTTKTNIFGYTSTSAASGSGFVLSENGYIVTTIMLSRTPSTTTPCRSLYPSRTVRASPPSWWVVSRATMWRC